MPVKGTSRQKKKLLAASRTPLVESEPACAFSQRQCTEVGSWLYWSLFCLLPFVCIIASSEINSGLVSIYWQSSNLSCVFCLNTFPSVISLTSCLHPGWTLVDFVGAGSDNQSIGNLFWVCDGGLHPPLLSVHNPIWCRLVQTMSMLC